MGRVCGALTTLMTALLMTGCASAQTISPRSFPALTANVAQAADARETREVRIRWTGGQTAQGPRSAGPGSFKLVGQSRLSGTPRRERQPEISESDLVVVVQDADGRDVDWRIVPNPRIIRAEAPGPDGLLSGRVVERDDVELLVLIPDVPGANRIQIYSPAWTGKDYRLDPLGQIDIGNGR